MSKYTLTDQAGNEFSSSLSGLLKRGIALSNKGIGWEILRNDGATAAFNCLPHLAYRAGYSPAQILETFMEWC